MRATPSHLKTSYCCFPEVKALRQTSPLLLDIFTPLIPTHANLLRPCFSANLCIEAPCRLGDAAVMTTQPSPGLASLCCYFAELRILPGAMIQSWPGCRGKKGGVCCLAWSHCRGQGCGAKLPSDGCLESGMGTAGTKP